MSDAADAISALQARNPYARDLARLASIAVQVEPELLRRLRLRLLLDADASAEADLWLSELVDSQSPNAMVLRADVRAQLQQELATSATDRDAAAAIIAEMHAGASEVMRIQEQVDALSLRDDPAARAQIEQILQPIVRTLYDKDHAGLARWAARAFAQFRPAAQETPAAWSMMRAAAVRLTSSGGSAERPIVVISSTFGELKEHRSAVISVLRGLGFEPVAYELAFPTSEDMFPAFKAIERASFFLGIIGYRYGYVPDEPSNPEHLSLSQLEYRRAIAAQIPVLMYLSNDEIVEPGANAFRVEVRTRGTYSTFKTVEELSDLVTRDFTKLRDAMTPSGWQNVEAAIRALPHTPLYLSLYQRSLVAGTTPVEGAARIDIPLTEPLLLDVAAQRISLAPGQSVEVQIDPRDLTVATILGEQYAIHTPVKFDDWAAIAAVDDYYDRATPFKNWIMEMTGGAIPADQCLEQKGPERSATANAFINVMRQVIWRLQDHRPNTLYVFVSGAYGSFFEIEGVLNSIREAATHFRSVILFVALDPNPDIRLELESNVYFIGAGRLLGSYFTSLLIDGLSGGAAMDGRVTPTSLAEFIRTQNVEHEGRAGDPSEPVLAAPDEFSSFVQIRSASQSGRLSVRLLDPSFTAIKVLEREVSYLKLLHGRYTLDAPNLALVQRFETATDDPVAIVEVGRRQRDHWIIVAGTAANEPSYDQQLIAAALGERLAGAGFRLLIGDWRGTDDTVLKAFLSMLATINVDSRDQVRQFTTSDRTSARIVTVNVIGDDEEYDAPLREASALIAIGGHGGTYEYGRRATARQIPVLPIEYTGGDAAKLYSELPASPDWLRNPTEDHTGADTMAIRIVAWLIDSLPPRG
jgi:hypothetical protein